MFWKSTAALPMNLPVRLARYATVFVFLSGTAAILTTYLPWNGPRNFVFWVSWGFWFGAAAGIFFSGSVRRLLERWRFQRLVGQAFSDCGSERNALIAAATSIRGNSEPRALQILQRMNAPTPKTPGMHARRWFSALAGVHWIARQAPFDTLPEKYERYPQLHALMFCSPGLRTPLRMKALSDELDCVSSADLDEYARAYIALVDALIAALNDPSAPFAARTPELLTLLTGRSHLLSAKERFAAWWKDLRPVYAHGGGAVLAGARLMQRAAFPDAAKLLERLARDGMLSQEAETLRRGARFLAIFMQSPWHVTSTDIPRYFAEGLYRLWNDLGVFRFPTAELPEIVACCKRGRIYRDAKRSLIEDTLDTWYRFGDELAEPLAFLMRKLLDERGRHQSTRLDFWRMKWDLCKRNFDKEVELLMTGIVRAANEDWAGALKQFDQATRLKSGGSLPLVNMVFILLKSGKHAEARRMIEHIQVLHPRDGQALLSLGRLLAVHTEDAPEAEKLFLKALSLLDPATDALNCLGEVKFLTGNYQESQSYFEQARRLSPEQPGPKLGLARVYMELKKFSDAVDVLKEVARDGPGEARDIAYYMLYRTHREAGEDRASVKYLEMLPARFFNDPDTIDDIAVHLESEKMYTKAREFAERAMLLRAHGKGRNDDPDALTA